MCSTQQFDWSQLTWEEIASFPSKGKDTVVLPIGATEQHGPHLGVGMDSNLAQLLCHTVCQKTEVPCLPLLPYGCSLGHSQKWAGTISLQPQTLISVVTEIGESVYVSGFRRLFIINSHVSNFAPLRCALEVLRSRYDDLKVALVNSAEINAEIRQEFFADAEDWHANAAETSLMQYLSPELVREEKVKDADDEDRTTGLVFSHPVNRTSQNGVTGTPSLASPEQGKKLFNKMVEGLSQLILRGTVEEPPLQSSYFTTHEKHTL